MRPGAGIILTLSRLSSFSYHCFTTEISPVNENGHEFFRLDGLKHRAVGYTRWQHLTVELRAKFAIGATCFFLFPTLVLVSVNILLLNYVV